MHIPNRKCGHCQKVLEVYKNDFFPSFGGVQGLFRKTEIAWHCSACNKNNTVCSFYTDFENPDSGFKEIESVLNFLGFEKVRSENPENKEPES